MMKSKPTWLKSSKTSKNDPMLSMQFPNSKKALLKLMQSTETDELKNISKYKEIKISTEEPKTHEFEKHEKMAAFKSHEGPKLDRGEKKCQKAVNTLT